MEGVFLEIGNLLLAFMVASDLPVLVPSPAASLPISLLDLLL